MSYILTSHLSGLFPPVTELDATDSKCANCDGEGWVCEDHPEVPWQDGDGCCGGAGSPCACNPLHNV